MARASSGSGIPRLRRQVASLQRKADRAQEEARTRKREAAKLRKVTAELKRTAGDLQTVLEHMSDGIMLFGRDFRWQLYNRNVCELQRFPPEIGHIGAHGDDILRYQALRGDFGPVIDLESMIEERRRLIMSGNASRYVRRAASGRMVEFEFKPLPDGRVLGVYRDITELKRTEEALKESEARYARAMRAATEGIYEWDAGTGALYLSDGAREFWGLPPGPLRNADWLSLILPEDYPAYRQAVIDHLKGRTPYLEHEVRARNASGEYRWLLDRGVAERNEDGRVTRMVGVTSDVTQRKSAERALRLAHQEVTEALERQTATAEVLRVISTLPTDLGPVLSAIVTTCRRLFQGRAAALVLPRGDMLEAAAFADDATAAGPGGGFLQPWPFDRLSAAGTSILENRAIAVTDTAQGELLFPRMKTLAAAVGGYRSGLFVPLLREGSAIGCIAILRAFPGEFAAKDLTLAQTFADQAVIAIEKVRMLNEAKNALEWQTATAQTLNVMARSPSDIQPVFDTIVRSAVRLCDGLFGAVYRYDGELIHFAAGYNVPPAALGRVRDKYPVKPEDQSVASSRAVLTRSVVRIDDVMADPHYDRNHAAGPGQWRRLLAVPMLRDGAPLGVIVILWEKPGTTPAHHEEMLKTFADQAVIAIENVRLFNELQEKSRQLEIAGRHKSEFVANMSHELRTPLNAIIGYSEMLREEAGPAQKPFVSDLGKIAGAGRHLLQLINAVLDLSKIEAGKMDVVLEDFSVQDLVEGVAAVITPLAEKNANRFDIRVAPEVEGMRADATKVRQTLFNLLSNACKFTQQGTVSLEIARETDSAGDWLKFTISDTGIGMTPEQMSRLFQDFTQVDPETARKYGGTGLGLALSRRLCRMMGGDISVTSDAGRGSSFLVRLPAHAGREAA
jgi:PAS domain S-box-containing protein